MGQRGLLFNERHPNTLLWPTLGNATTANTANLNFNNLLYELYFYYLFLYEPQVSFLGTRCTPKHFNVRYYKKQCLPLSYTSTFLTAPLYKIFRYHHGILVLLILIKYSNPAKLIVTPITLYRGTKLFHKNS